MITASETTKDLLKKNSTLSMTVGATIDYNMNSMVNFSSSPITTNATGVSASFQKLFPLDTILKPIRPVSAGVKYGVSGDVLANSYADPTTVVYSPELIKNNVIKYRTYYPGVNTYYKYWISPLNQNPTVSITYPKTIVANKIVIRFEISHATPSAWTVSIGGSQIASGTASDIKNFNSTSYDAGTLTLYYNGTAWTKTESSLNKSASVSLTSLSLSATNPGGYIGIIEVAPHWVIDISDNIVDFTVTKETSSSTEDLIPVGNITANHLDLSLNKYNSSAMQFKSYDKTDTIDTTKIYLYKQAMINLYINVSQIGGNPEKINQGYFFIDNWNISEFGDVSVTALDSAKILQEILAPDILCQNYSAIAICRRLLDSVGFTNYNFNYKNDDKSILSPDYWWTDSKQTVWSNLQSICRDSQMTAFIDENNVLQFYTRESIFDSSKTAVWKFTNQAIMNGQNVDYLPNIISFSKNDLPSVNQVKIIYYSTVSSEYEQSSTPLWNSGQSYLAASAITADIPTTADPANSGTHYISLSPIDPVTESNQQTIYSFNGYLLIGSEIIEYDAIQYQFIAKSPLVINGISYAADATVLVDVAGENDLLKYRGEAKVNNISNIYKTTFIPTGKYRIKKRGALGTSKQAHFADPNTQANGWYGATGVKWK